MSWSEIPGQEFAKNVLQNQLREERLSHAYLFSGAKGLGKKALALELAAASLCSRENSESCGSCLSCQKISHDNHPDVQVFGPAESKKSLGIDVIRELQRELALKPFEAGRRFFVIEKAEEMTAQAANSLLKSLEEPPAYAVLILLVSEESRLLPTIISRCQQLNLHPLSRGKITSLLQERGIRPQFASHIARLAAGSPGRAQELAEKEELLERRNEVLNFLAGLEQKNDIEIFSAVSKWSDWFAEDFPLIQILSEWCRDLIVYSRSGSEDVRNHNFLQEIEGIAASSNFDQLSLMLELVEKAADDIDANVMSDLVLSVLLFDLKTLMEADETEKVDTQASVYQGSDL